MKNLANPIIMVDKIVLARPHFRMGERSLFFMESKRPQIHLTEAEVQIWEEIQKPTHFSVLRDHFPSCADEAIEKLYRVGACEMIEKTFPDKRKRILVVEPHADDAALSVGGTMWLKRHQCQFIVATMASRSNFTSYYYTEHDYFNVQTVMDIRRRESLLFTRMVGGTHIEVGMTDAVLRYCDTDWTLDFFKKHRSSISAATSRYADQIVIEKWLAAVKQLFTTTETEEIWIPLGSPHTDHQLTMNTCIRTLVENPTLASGKIIRIYQDVPYDIQFPQYTVEMKVALDKIGLGLKPETALLGDAYLQKLRLISLYGSQFKLSAMQSKIEASAKAHGSNGLAAELLWTITNFPKFISKKEILPVSNSRSQNNKSTKAWLSQNKRSAFIRILLQTPTGQWANDIKLLKQYFPSAQFDVFASPSAFEEVNSAVVNGVNVYRVKSGFFQWVILGLRFTVAKRIPTLFIASQQRIEYARLISKFWIGTNTLVADSMNVLVQIITHSKENNQMLGLKASK